MTRFHLIAILSAIASTIALALHRSILLNAVVLAFLIAVGLGVAIPQMRLFGNFICSGNRKKKTSRIDL